MATTIITVEETIPGWYAVQVTEGTERNTAENAVLLPLKIRLKVGHIKGVRTLQLWPEGMEVGFYADPNTPDTLARVIAFLLKAVGQKEVRLASSSLSADQLNGLKVQLSQL